MPKCAYHVKRVIEHEYDKYQVGAIKTYDDETDYSLSVLEVTSQ